MRPLFVCGCARSGTTAMARLLGAHPRVLMGIERYGKRLSAGLGIEPQHLRLERFARIEEGDTFYQSFEGRQISDPLWASKLAGDQPLDFIGDKKPRLYRYFDSLQEVFPSARILMIYRNPLHVARSWEHRARIRYDRWPAANDALAAAREWNTSLECARAAVAAGQKMALVSYEAVFGTSHYRTIFDWLSLAPAPEVDEAQRLMQVGHERAQANIPGMRSDPLPADRVEAVRNDIDQALWNWAENVALVPSSPAR